MCAFTLIKEVFYRTYEHVEVGVLLMICIFINVEISLSYLCSVQADILHHIFYDFVHSDDVVNIKKQLSTIANNDANVKTDIKQIKSDRLCPGAKRSFLCRMKKGAIRQISADKQFSSVRGTKDGVLLDESSHVLGRFIIKFFNCLILKKLLKRFNYLFYSSFLFCLLKYLMFCPVRHLRYSFELIDIIGKADKTFL